MLFLIAPAFRPQYWRCSLPQCAGEVDPNDNDKSVSATRSTSGCQTAANTVVVGQKIHAKVETSSKISLHNTYGVEWMRPQGGDVVRDYITDDSEGRVVTLEETYYNTGGSPACYFFADDFVFYYTSKSSSTLAYLSAGISVIDVNGNLHGTGATASFYVETPTVTSYTSEWANWPGTNEQPVDVRTRNINGVDIECLILGEFPSDQDFSPGIEWTAKVAAPAVIGGGEIAYNQQISFNGLRFFQGTAIEKLGNAKTNQGMNWQWMVDTLFPYPDENDQPSVPVNTTLVAYDSPGSALVEKKAKPTLLNPLYTQHYDKYMRWDNFVTYLIYKPEGKDSIWVTLSEISWHWNGTAEYENGQWKLTDGDYSGGGNGTATSYLPEWDANAASYLSWIDI